MSEEHARDAIDINDFVYAATGARVRRLTLPDGEHWFPAVDVCRELGYTTTRKALQDHVPEKHRDLLETVTGSHSLSIPAGRMWRRDLQMIDLKGLILLVNGCTKPSCLPFKEWVTNVITTIQRDGSYTLEKAEVQPTSPRADTAYAMPQQVADAIVRLEERIIRSDEEWAAAQREANQSRRDLVSTQQQAVQALNALAEAQQRAATAMYEVMTETVRSSQDASRNMSRVANALERLVDRLPPPRAEAAEAEAEVAWLPRQRSASATDADGLTADQLLASWRARVTITEDVWSVAVLLAPALVEHGEAHFSVESIAQRTGLTTARVHDSLRFLLKRQCLRQVGTIHDAPVYTVHHA
jgi:prophage antirepressor-like protein